MFPGMACGEGMQSWLWNNLLCRQEVSSRCRGGFLRPHTPFPPVDNGGANPRFLQVGESDLLYEVPDGRRHRSMQATVRLRDPRDAALSHGRLPRGWWHVGFDGASTPGVVGLVCDSQAPSRGRCLPLEKRGRELTGSLPPVRNGDRRQEGGPERTELLAGPPYRHRSLLAEDAHRQSVAFAQVQPLHQVHRRARGDHARPSRVVRRSQQRERPEVQDVGLCRGSAVTRGHEVLQHVRTGVRMEMRCHEPPHSTGCSRTLASLPKRAARRTLLLPGTCEPGRGLAALQQDGRLVRAGTRSKGGRGCRGGSAAPTEGTPRTPPRSDGGESEESGYEVRYSLDVWDSSAAGSPVVYREREGVTRASNGPSTRGASGRQNTIRYREDPIPADLLEGIQTSELRDDPPQELLRIWGRTEVRAGFFTEALPDPVAYNADGTRRLRPTLLEVFHCLGKRVALRDQHVGALWMRRAKRQATETAPRSSYNLRSRSRTDRPPPPRRPHRYHLRSRGRAGALEDPAWMPPLATATGVDGVPYTGPAPPVPRDDRFDEENRLVLQFQQLLSPPALRGKPRLVPAGAKDYRMAVVQKLFDN